MKPKSTKGFIFFLIFGFVCFELGNSIRNLIVEGNHIQVNFENPIFTFVFAKNSGGAYSILENQTNLLAIFGAIVLFALLVYMYKKISFENKFELLSLTVFFAGVLGNTVERFANGFVIDYIKLKFIDFPVFNAFDIMICTGVILYSLFLIFGEKLFKKEKIKNEN